VLNLIVKDMLIQKKQLIFAIIYFLFLTLVFQNSSFPLSALMHFWITIVIVYTFITAAAACDDKSVLVLNSLPIKRKSIVLAKYSSAFVYAAAVLLAIALISNVVPDLGAPIALRPLTAGEIAGALAGTALFCSYYFPLYFKFGTFKTRYINMLALLFLFFAPGLLMDLIKLHPYRLVRFASAINKISLWQLETMTALVLLAILLLSLFISLRIYESRDF
jgi:hypothetical protein